MNAVMSFSMELRRVNVMLPDDIHSILSNFQRAHDIKSKDKALAELLKEYKRLAEN